MFFWLLIDRYAYETKFYEIITESQLPLLTQLQSDGYLVLTDYS